MNEISADSERFSGAIAIREDDDPKLTDRLILVRFQDLLLLSPPKPKKHAARGRLQLVFEAAAKLPRRQQDKIAEFVEAFVASHANEG